MADVTINYKGSKVAELSDSGAKTLKTSGKYCEGDVSVIYTKPATEKVNCKIYTVTLSKQFGQILLATLDDEVKAHINDDSLVVTLTNMSACDNQNYTGYNYIARNMAYGQYGSYPIYGMCDRFQGGNKTAPFNIYYPANYTGTDTSKGGYGVFHYISGKYYITPGDGYIGAVTYRLTFTW